MFANENKKIKYSEKGSVQTDYLEVIESDTQGPFPIIASGGRKTMLNLWIKKVDTQKCLQFQIGKLQQF